MVRFVTCIVSGWLEKLMIPGRLSGLVGIEQDITERMKAESAIKESEQRYHSLFSSLTEGFAYCQMIFNKDA